MSMAFWFMQEIYGVPVSRLILKAKALTMYQKTLQINVHLCLC